MSIKPNDHVLRACGGPCDGVEHPLILRDGKPSPLIGLPFLASEDTQGVPFYDAAYYAYDKPVTDGDRTVHLYRHQPKPTRPATGASIGDTFPVEWCVGESMPLITVEVMPHAV